MYIIIWHLSLPSIHLNVHHLSSSLSSIHPNNVHYLSLLISYCFHCKFSISPINWYVTAIFPEISYIILHNAESEASKKLTKRKYVSWLYSRRFSIILRRLIIFSDAPFPLMFLCHYILFYLSFIKWSITLLEWDIKYIIFDNLNILMSILFFFFFLNWNKNHFPPIFRTLTSMPYGYCISYTVHWFHLRLVASVFQYVFAYEFLFFNF